MSKMIQWRAMKTLCSLLVVLGNGSQAVKADFVFGEPTKVPNINSGFSDGSPRISPDGLTLYFNSNRDHVEGECYRNIWVSTRPTVSSPWSAPVKLDAPVNGPGSEQSPSVSADGLELYFSDGYPGFDQWGGCMPNPKGYGHSDLWVSRRGSTDEPWGVPENLGPVINSAGAEDTPCISADGLELYFMYEYPVGQAYGPHSEIMVTTRASKADPWGKPVNLGPNVNSNLYEYTPWVSPDGLSLWFSRGFCQAHIYVCRRATKSDAWGPAEFFSPVNSGVGVYRSQPGNTEFCLSFSYEDSTLYFTRGTNLFTWDYDIWQVKVEPVVDFNADGILDVADVFILAGDWGPVGKPSGPKTSRCDIAPFPLGDGQVNEKDLAVLLEAITGTAYVTDPGPDASEVSPDAVLTWPSVPFAATYDVYFGSSFKEVEGADRSHPGNVLVSVDQATSSYDPAGLMDYGRTYFWRVDFVGPGPEFSVVKGSVLSFRTATPWSVIQNVTAQASSSGAGSSPERTVDGSGLDASDGHSTNATDMWQSGGAGPHWIEFTFDDVYTLQEMWVWNSNQLVEPFIGFGARTVKIEYSADSATWTVLEGVPEFAKAPGRPGYEADTVVSFGGVSARYVRLTIERGWGVTSSVGLSEVRFFYVPDRPASHP